MPVRLRGASVSPEQRRAHDRHRPWVVLPVLGVLLLYCWCFTDLARWLHLPRPQDVVDGLGLALPEVLDPSGRVDAKLRASHSTRMSGADERALVFAALFGCFLCVYFLPLRWKKLAMVAWFFPAFAAIYGLHAALMVLAAHLAVYLAFHPENPRGPRIAAALAALLAYLFAAKLAAPVAAAIILLAALAAAALYRRLAPALAPGGRGVEVLRTVLVQATMISVLVACAREGLTGEAWKLPVGLLFFFYQWARLMVYRADHRDGEVPRDLDLPAYLSVFLSPVGLFNMAYAPYLGQGHAYLEERHLAEDKTRTVLSGVRLWCLALAYLVFAEQLTRWFLEFMAHTCGVKVFAFTSQLVRAHLKGEELSTPTVLLSTLVDQARIFLVYGGVTHFRVGAWRVMGYGVDTQYDRPWLATNLANLWGRFAFHFREFLVRCFYYPVFLRFFRRRRFLRIFFATMVATVVGNLVWGHVPSATLNHLEWSSLTTLLSTWPYFALLGLGISLTQVYMASRPRTRRPWTLDRRLPLDLLCAYLTLQFFALIHIYIRPQPGGSLWASTRLVLRGLGVDLD